MAVASAGILPRFSTSSLLLHVSTTAALATGCVSLPVRVEKEFSALKGLHASTETGLHASTETETGDTALGSILIRGAAKRFAGIDAASIAERGDNDLDSLPGEDVDEESRFARILQRVKDIGEGAADGVDQRLGTREGRAILGVIGTNVAVFCLWKVLPSPVMVRHFTSSLEAMRRGRVWTALSSNFSHMGVFHLSANMYLLDLFGRDVAAIMKPERLLVLYVAGGIASVLGSLAARRVMGNNVLSLGASGSIMAIMCAFTCLFPERELSILGIWTLNAKDALVLWMLIDCCGLLGSFGRVDFAAHLSGLAFGAAYYNYIREQLANEWERRQREERWRKWRFWLDGGNDE
jgi:membrane associated rhomboid family serine protease